MAVDQQEQNRKLTEAETRRLKNYEQMRDEMVSQGYRPTELTVGIVRANIVAMLAAIPLVVVGFGLFVLVNQGKDWGFSRSGWLVDMFILLVLIVVHEGIHGLTWSFFTPHRFKEIEFGFMKEYLTPYCACTCPLSKWHYITGALAPLVVLGIIPTVVAIATGSLSMLLIGLFMIISAGGDVMLVWQILRHKQTGSEMLVVDHPTQAGSVVFER